MGNLNQFYLMGRVARALQEVEGGVSLALNPGTGARAPRGAQPLDLFVAGPQVPAAKALTVGTPVLLRGQLRQEGDEAGSRLVARVQAIEILAGEDGEAPRGGGGGGSRPRKRRRRRKPREGGKGEGEQGEGGGKEASASGDKPTSNVEVSLPPAKPVVDPASPPPAPPPDTSTDMPF